MSGENNGLTPSGLKIVSIQDTDMAMRSIQRHTMNKKIKQFEAEHLPTADELQVRQITFAKQGSTLWIYTKDDDGVVHRVAMSAITP